MFRAGTLLITRRYNSAHTATGICHAFMLTACWQDPANRQSTYRMTCVTNCCICRVLPPGDEQCACSKHV